MFLHCLGVAAGGGFPQWNCACPGCRQARSRPEIASAHAGLAVSGTGERWFLLNATPTRVDWDYMFTLQWTVAAVRDRYALPAAQTGARGLEPGQEDLSM